MSPLQIASVGIVVVCLTGLILVAIRRCWINGKDGKP
jgi:hypothetical protein